LRGPVIPESPSPTLPREGGRGGPYNEGVSKSQYSSIVGT